MATKDWKKIRNDKNQKRWVNKKTNDWIYVTKTTLVKEWEVASNKNINPSSINPRFKYFKSSNRVKNRSSALKFAHSYMRTH